MKYSKKAALGIVFDAAKKYRDFFINYALLIISNDKHKNIHYTELTFDASNFKHLTGFVTTIEANHFFNLCIAQRLSVDDFEFSNDGTTQLKLLALPKLMKKDLSAKMIGDYDGFRPKLITEKIAGNISACIGFTKTGSNGRYVPNTVLEGDIRDLVKKPERIILTYRKYKTDKNYSEIVYQAKKFDFNTLNFSDEYKYLPIPK